MYEKVNPYHPDKVADRIAGAIVDLAYKREDNPKIAVEVLIGHNLCTIICESSVEITQHDVEAIVDRIDRPQIVNLICVKQDKHLASNQADAIRCGDNGIFKGLPVTSEQYEMAFLAHDITAIYPTDGKYILDCEKDTLIICQSNCDGDSVNVGAPYANLKINPLGFWTGGTDVDSGATNRKLGSDMGDSVTGGGLHGKDLSKADVSVNIYAWLKAQKTGKPVQISCAIGDDTIDGKPYSKIVQIARDYINDLGGFEKFAEWGLIR